MSSKQQTQIKTKKVFLILTNLENELQEGFENKKEIRRIENFRYRAFTLMNRIKDSLGNYEATKDKSREERKDSILFDSNELIVTVEIIIGLNGKLDKKAKYIVKLLVDVYREVRIAILNLDSRVLYNQELIEIETFIGKLNERKE